MCLDEPLALLNDCRKPHACPPRSCLHIGPRCNRGGERDLLVKSPPWAHPRLMERSKRGSFLCWQECARPLIEMGKSCLSAVSARRVVADDEKSVGRMHRCGKRGSGAARRAARTWNGVRLGNSRKTQLTWHTSVKPYQGIIGDALPTCQNGRTSWPDACTWLLSSSHRVVSETSFPVNQAGGYVPAQTTRQRASPGRCYAGDGHHLGAPAASELHRCSLFAGDPARLRLSGFFLMHRTNSISTR
jgi:hypothetical protein